MRVFNFSLRQKIHFFYHSGLSAPRCDVINNSLGSYPIGLIFSANESPVCAGSDSHFLEKSYICFPFFFPVKRVSYFYLMFLAFFLTCFSVTARSQWLLGLLGYLLLPSPMVVLAMAWAIFLARWSCVLGPVFCCFTLTYSCLVTVFL